MAISVAVADATTSGPKLSISMAGVHHNHTFNYTVHGTFNHSTLSKVYVIGLRQPWYPATKNYTCRATEPADWSRPASRQLHSWTESSSPFTATGTWTPPSYTAVPNNEAWRMCVYMYNKKFTTLGNSDGAHLLASATAVVPK